ncbi:hypothetical protein HDU98_001463, partial [Podochytrium sp. JEL0797]
MFAPTAATNAAALAAAAAASAATASALPSPEPNAAAQTHPAAAAKPRSRRSHAKRRDPSEILRPANAFILYRTKHQPFLVQEFKGQGKSSRDFSAMVGAQWRSESTQVRTHYQNMAKQIMEEHRRKYPDYRYRQPKTSKKSSASAAVSFSEADDSSSPECSSMSSSEQEDDELSSECASISCGRPPAPTTPRSKRLAAQRAINLGSSSLSDSSARSDSPIPDSTSVDSAPVIPDSILSNDSFAPVAVSTKKSTTQPHVSATSSPTTSPRKHRASKPTFSCDIDNCTSTFSNNYGLERHKNSSIHSPKSDRSNIKSSSRKRQHTKRSHRSRPRISITQDASQLINEPMVDSPIKIEPSPSISLDAAPTLVQDIPQIHTTTSDDASSFINGEFFSDDASLNQTSRASSLCVHLTGMELTSDSDPSWLPSTTSPSASLSSSLQPLKPSISTSLYFQDPASPSPITQEEHQDYLSYDLFPSSPKLFTPTTNPFSWQLSNLPHRLETPSQTPTTTTPPAFFPSSTIANAPFLMHQNHHVHYHHTQTPPPSVPPLIVPSHVQNPAPHRPVTSTPPSTPLRARTRLPPLLTSTTLTPLGNSTATPSESSSSFKLPRSPWNLTPTSKFPFTGTTNTTHTVMEGVILEDASVTEKGSWGEGS